VSRPYLRAGGRAQRERRVGGRRQRAVFLIVCEGEKTEPNYFKSFRVPSDVAHVVGAGAETLAVVEEAARLSELDSYDQVWCVFDRDSAPAERFNRALTLARRRGFHVAYSNEAFELWYLLHFHFLNTGISRRDYIQRLQPLIAGGYQKNDPDIYAKLHERQDDAIRNATRLLSEYPNPNPERDKPSTTVHLLVQELNRYLPG
jgi:hypothetical protein